MSTEAGGQAVVRAQPVCLGIAEINGNDRLMSISNAVPVVSLRYYKGCPGEYGYQCYGTSGDF